VIPSFRTRRPIRVVLSSSALLPFTSSSKASAEAIAQLGIAAFFAAGISTTLGPGAFWVVLIAAGLSAFARAMDVESWGLLIPGGFPSTVKQAFGPRAANAAAALALVERLLLAALASVVCGHYLVNVSVTTLAGQRLTGFVRPEDLATVFAIFAIGLIWITARLGRDVDRDAAARGVWISVGLLVAIVVWAGASVAQAGIVPAPLVVPDLALDADSLGRLAVNALIGVVIALPVIGGGDILARSAHEFAPPRVPTLRRISVVTVAFTLLVTVLGTLFFISLVPEADRNVWADSPLAGLAQHLAGPEWIRRAAAFAVAAAAVVILLQAARAAIRDLERQMAAFSRDYSWLTPFTSLTARLAVPTRTAELSAGAAVLVVIVSGARVTWLAHAYGFAIALTFALRALTLLHFRRAQHETRPFTTPGNVHVRRRELPIGLVTTGVFVTLCAAVLLGSGDGPAIATAGVIVVIAIWSATLGESHQGIASESDRAAFDLLPSSDLSLGQIDARPGNLLVPVRNPHALGHVAMALRAAGDRDVVIMTVRLVADDAHAAEREPTAYERHLLSEVVAIAERSGRPIRLLIVPASTVADAIVATVLRLRSSEVYVGESTSLSAADQARLLGDAWERADKPDALDVRLVIHHRSGRSEVYHLGAHPPSLSPSDLDLIHRIWLDAVNTVGPHVHHHDIVRAALTQMEQQLSGPQRDDAVAAIRSVAQPAEELVAVLRTRDYTRLRDMLRNRHAGDVATLLTALSIEDQVVVFRVLPRKDAAAVFEYLSQEAKESLLKAMAQEDVAALLNNMAPDDRTLFLEELPAEATRQLLALLTPAERSVAATLLGYPERSVGRLMTPHYIAVRDHWTVREVLDYVRAHGQDSETLNVIYVVDDHGLLIDDVRIREFLLAPLERHVSELMDRRFVALKATDAQDNAVAVFRQYDRTALPVTDTVGMLIGIVTIDDVLDVAEATATREIQRIGGSEALDEPYISIAFWRMIQKRAGWLTALFLGEMLTATAMGAFEAEISKAVVLALFVPLIISSGGNSGSQAATLVIRALALGEVTIRDWWQVMRREIFAGLALGAILGSIGFLRITLWSAFSDIYGPHWLLVAITVSCSLVGVVLWGTLSGSLLPFLLKRLGFDPAASSAPFVATLVDVTGLVIYFSVALVVLRGTLL
jgi:magnesium transporter